MISAPWATPHPPLTGRFRHDLPVLAAVLPSTSTVDGCRPRVSYRSDGPPWFPGGWGRLDRPALRLITSSLCFLAVGGFLAVGATPTASFEVPMDISAFYAVMAGINFTLLGLWWVAVQERSELRRPGTRTGQLAYVVSLQFLLPGTVSLLSQVAPTVPFLWRSAFVLGGAAGLASIVLLVPILLRTRVRLAARLLLLIGVPIHALIVIVALLPDLGGSVSGNLSNLQIEAILFCLLVLLGAQTAWTAAMTPLDDQPAR